MISKLVSKTLSAMNILTEDGESTIAIEYPESGEKTGSLVLNEDFIPDLKHHRVISNTAFPLKPRVLEPGQATTRKSHYTVAQWDRRRLKIAIPEDSITLNIARALTPAIITLVTGGARHIASEHIFRKKFSLGLQEERARLLNSARGLQRSGEEQLKRAEATLASASRQKKLAENLDVVNSKSSEDVATVQWRNICSLIPAALQDVFIEGYDDDSDNGSLCAITQQFFVEGCLLGPYYIRATLPTRGDPIVSIEATPEMCVPESGHPHPHVGPSGNPCWGTLVDSVSKMLANKDYFGLISAAIRLLAQYRPDDHYVPINFWGDRAVLGNSEAVCSRMSEAPVNFDNIFQIKQCLSCSDSERGTCPVWSNERIFTKCYDLAGPHDCVECEHTDCPQHDTRFSRCFASAKKLGTAYCMLSCERIDECPYKDEARELCMANLPEEVCPAGDRCHQPCDKAKTTGEEHV